MPERVADRSTIFGHPVAPELEEVVHPVHIHLRPDKESAVHIEIYAATEMHLKVIGTLHVEVAALAPTKRVTGILVEIEP